MMEQKSSLDQTSSESFFFFNPRTPCGVRHDSEMTLSYFTLFQSTHSLRSATIATGIIYLLHHVSIHALLAECDGVHTNIVRLCTGFNPRTPCGVRRSAYKHCAPLYGFQSTHSLRSATFGFLWNCNCSTWFQSTHSLRSATNHQRGQPPRNSVSIHALLAECDHKRVHRSLYHLSFNPRTPCGVRPSCLYHRYLPHRFQSTHSLRSATPDCYFALYVLCVSIHALLAECDRLSYTGKTSGREFQSTHSLRSATVIQLKTIKQ